MKQKRRKDTAKGRQAARVVKILRKTLSSGIAGPVTRTLKTKTSAAGSVDLRFKVQGIANYSPGRSSAELTARPKAGTVE